MARCARRPSGQAIAAFLLLLLALSLLAPGLTASTSVTAPQGETVDALGRSVPPGMAGPVRATLPLGPLPQSQNNDVTFEVIDVTSDYGPETYKDDYLLETRSADAFENQTTNWDTALGHHIRFTVEVNDGRSTLDCDDTFVAVALIETTHGPLYGWTNGTYHQPGGIDDVCLSGLPGVRIYEMVFDLDGAPAPVVAAPQPALMPGYYLARLELYHYDPSPTNPTGQGMLAGATDIGFALQDPRLSLDPPLVRFPERMLRMISDTGGHATHTHQFAMPLSPLAGSETWRLTMEFAGTSPGTPFTRIDHHATRTLPGIDLPAHPGALIGETPLDALLEKIQDQADRGLLGVEMHRTEYESHSVGESRVHSMDLRADDFPTRTGVLDEYTPMHIVTIHIPADTQTFTTGAESIVVPVTHREYPLRSLSIEADLPPLPVTRIVLQDDEEATGGPLGVNAGDLFALRPAGAGHEIITHSRLERETDSEWVTGELRHIEFSDEPRRYHLVSMLYGPLDEFLGIRILERGLYVEAQSIRFVEGTTGRLPVTIHLPPIAVDGQEISGELEFTVRVQARDLGANGEYDTNITLRPGETKRLDLPVRGSEPGTYAARITASNGELTARTEAPIEVLTTEAYEAENRRWYEIPDLSALIVVLAALAAIAVLRPRRGT